MTAIINLNKNELQAIASMINLTSPKDHVASLTMVRVTVNLDGSLSLVATNRMVIAEQSFMPHSPVLLSGNEPLVFLLSPNLLKPMKQAKFDGSLSIGDEAITYSNYSGSSLNEPLYKGKFPEIEDMLPSKIETDTLIPATDYVRLNLDFVTKISNLVSPLDHKTDLPVFEIRTQAAKDNGKPKPVLFQRANIRAIIQPVMSK
jgi:hypothetical protein